jgi:hypothetical protein
MLFTARFVCHLRDGDLFHLHLLPIVVFLLGELSRLLVDAGVWLEID